MAGSVEHFDLHFGLLQRFGHGVFGHELVVEAAHLFRCAVGPMRGALEEVHHFFPAVKNAAKLLPEAERPVDGAGADAQHGLQLVHQGQRLARRAVELVHEGEDGHAAAAADLEELARLRLDAFAGIDDHDGGIHSS